MVVTLLLKVGKISLRFGKSNWIIYSKFLSILTGLWWKKKKKTNKETRETEYCFSTWKECGLCSPRRHKSLGECMLLSHLISWHFSFFVKWRWCLLHSIAVKITAWWESTQCTLSIWMLLVLGGPLSAHDADGGQEPDQSICDDHVERLRVLWRGHDHRNWDIELSYPFVRFSEKDTAGSADS